MSSPDARTACVELPTAADWWAGPFEDHLDRHHDPAPAGRPGRPPVRFPELTAALFRALHADQIAQGASPQAAAKWICTGFAGAVATAVGFTLATTSAALAVQARDVSWRCDPDGWPDRVDLGPVRLIVTADHPWAGQQSVRIVGSIDEVREAALSAVLQIAAPVVETVRTLAKVGRNALWAEIADCLGAAVSYQPHLRVEALAVAELDAITRMPGAPWRSRPTLVIADTVAGPAYVAQKGGCCLAYQSLEPPAVDDADGGDCRPVECPPDDGDDSDPTGHAAFGRAYRERFPPDPDTPDYCSNCSLMEFAECRRRQQFTVEYHRARVEVGVSAS